MNAAAKGYKAIFVMPDNMTQERISILKAYGAQVILTPAVEKMPGAVKKRLNYIANWKTVLFRNSSKIQQIQRFIELQLHQKF